MTDALYDRTDAWAYGMLELIGTFIARADTDPKGWRRLKELVPQYCGGGTSGRAYEAAISQLMAQIERIQEHRG